MKYTAFGLTVETRLNFANVLQISDSPVDVVIEEGEVGEKAGRLTRVRRRGLQARFGKKAGSVILNWETVGKFRISDGTKITYQNLGADEETLKLFLLSEVFGIILYQRGIFLLHASAVEIGGGAFVFAGVPGAGKSTTATAFGKAGLTVLTDDLTAVQIIDSKPFVLPAFAQYKVWKSALAGLNIDFTKLPPSFEGAEKFLVTQNLTLFPRQPVQLKRLTILSKPQSKIENEKLNPLLAPVKLLEHFPLPIQLLTQEYLRKHFEQSLEIARNAPIYLMKRPENFGNLEKMVEHFKRSNTQLPAQQ